MSGFTSVQLITRTNDTNVYSANDVIGAATGATAAISFPLIRQAGVVRIRSSLFIVQSTGVISGETSYNLHLYDETPPSALGDNAAWDLPAGDLGVYLGSLALGTPVDIGSNLVIATDSFDRYVYLKTGTLYAYLVTVGTYTPTASRVYRTRLTGEFYPPLTTEQFD